jgi:hypothetical protein
MTEPSDEPAETEAQWACAACGFDENPLSQPSCGDCGRTAPASGPAPAHPSPPRPTQAPTEAPRWQRHDTPHGGLHGWRITLPDFSMVALPTGSHTIGRGDVHPAIARVLRLFPDVSRAQLELDVTTDFLEVHVPSTSRTLVFHVQGDQFTQIVTQAMSPSDAWTLCLGQSCFVRIDRGVA